MNKVFVDMITDYVNELISIEDLEDFLLQNKEYVNKYFSPLNFRVYRGVNIVGKSKYRTEEGRLKSYSKDKEVATMFSIRQLLSSESKAFIITCNKGLYFDVNKFLGYSKYEDEDELIVFAENPSILKVCEIPKVEDLKDALTVEYYNKIKGEILGGFIYDR